MIILNKDYLKFVTQFPFLLRHPVTNINIKISIMKYNFKLLKVIRFNIFFGINKKCYFEIIQ